MRTSLLKCVLSGTFDAGAGGVVPAALGLANPKAARRKSSGGSHARTGGSRSRSASHASRSRGLDRAARGHGRTKRQTPRHRRRFSEETAAPALVLFFLRPRRYDAVGASIGDGLPEVLVHVVGHHEEDAFIGEAFTNILYRHDATACLPGLSGHARNDFFQRGTISA